jgi:phosphorylated CTD-interacting factor 1
MVLFCVAQRYSTLFGPDAFETAAMHAALPEFGFRLLHRRLGVCQENYASPFNCYFRHFNSAFGDTDAWLGSLGSFADFVPVEGSFETGPPYTQEAMDQMAVQLMQHLQQSERPLSFVVFVPDWRKPLLEAQRLMEGSRFLRDDIVLPGRRYRYVVGHQHQADQRADERYFVLPMDTHLYVLQNAAGAAKWPCEGVLRELVQEMERLAGELSRVPNNISGRQLPPPNARRRSPGERAEGAGAPAAKRAHLGVGASDSAREEGVGHK